MALTYRVGTVDNTNKAVDWVKEEFGVNANSLGHLNPQIVDQMNLDAIEMGRQVKFAASFIKATEKIMKGKVDIEAMRKDLLEKGLASKEDVDGIVQQMIMLTEKHQGHIGKMLQDMQQGKAMIGAKFKSQSELSRSSFQNNIRELRARHNSTQREMNEASRESIQAIDSDRAKARGDRAASRKFNDFLSGKQHLHRQFEIGGGRRPQSLHSKSPSGDRGGSTFGSKGLLRSLFG